MNSSYKQIYLDFNATTPCDERVVEAMLPYFSVHFGNASSAYHPYGWLAKGAIEDATVRISGLLGVSPGELVYTSGATESINMLLKGLYLKNRSERDHIVTARTEHKAVLDVCKYLESLGAKVTYLDVDDNGLICLNQLEEVVSAKTLVVAIMLANNETGVIQDLQAVSDFCRSRGVFLFSDATQALGKIPLNAFFEQVDMACFSGHKLYGPKGVGLTYINDAVKPYLDAFIHGGGQQSGQRGGTYNTPAIVGLAEAVHLAVTKLGEEAERMKGLRDRLEDGLSAIEETVINGGEVNRLPNTLNMSFRFVDGEVLLRSLSRHMAVSNGSACNSASVFPSHVLSAMGMPEDLAFSSIRFSLGRFTEAKQIEEAIELVTREVAHLRSSNILWERRRR